MDSIAGEPGSAGEGEARPRRRLRLANPMRHPHLCSFQVALLTAAAAFALLLAQALLQVVTGNGDMEAILFAVKVGGMAAPFIIVFVFFGVGSLLSLVRWIWGTTIPVSPPKGPNALEVLETLQSDPDLPDEAEPLSPEDISVYGEDLASPLEAPNTVDHYYEPEPHSHSPTKDSRSILATILGTGAIWLVWTFFKTDTFAMTKLVDGKAPYIVLIVVVFSIAGIAAFLRSRRASLVMEERSAGAKRILHNIQLGREVSPFVLYLRPFAIGSGHSMNDMLEGEIDFESVLANALLHIGPLVAVGRPDPRPGAAKLESSEVEWFERVSALMAASHLIVIVLGGGEGLRKELEIIQAQAYLSKAIFIRPTGLDSETWDEAGKAAAEFGWSVPLTSPRAGDACVFVLSLTGTPIQIEKLPMDLSVAGYRSAIGAALSALWQSESVGG